VVRPTTADVLAAFQDWVKEMGQAFSGIFKPVGTLFNRTLWPVNTSDNCDIQPVNTLVDIPVNSLVPEPIEVENKQKAHKWSFLAIFHSKRKPLNFLKSQSSFWCWNSQQYMLHALWSYFSAAQL